MEGSCRALEAGQVSEELKHDLGMCKDIHHGCLSNSANSINFQQKGTSSINYSSLPFRGIPGSSYKEQSYFMYSDSEGLQETVLREKHVRCRKNIYNGCYLSCEKNI